MYRGVEKVLLLLQVPDLECGGKLGDDGTISPEMSAGGGPQHRGRRQQQEVMEHVSGNGKVSIGYRRLGVCGSHGKIGDKAGSRPDGGLAGANQEDLGPGSSEVALDERT